MAQNLEIESSDIIRLILQFLKENNLNRSLQMLQEESRVTLDAVESIDQLVDDVQNGRWDNIIQTVATITLPEETVHLLYEQMVCEMLELQEMELASSLLRETAALQSLRLVSPERYKRLQRLCNKTFCEGKEIFEGISKDKRRQIISQNLTKFVISARPSRLLSLIGMAIKWQRYQGLISIYNNDNNNNLNNNNNYLNNNNNYLNNNNKFNLLTNTPHTYHIKKDLPVQHISQTIKFGKNSHPECALFSPDGQYLISGSVDGFIEIWNWMNGTLNTELLYQKEDNLMMHEDAVLSLAISRDSEILATGGQSGQLKVWKIQTGACVRKFDKAHDAGITSICFSRDSLMLLTASFDQTARAHGLKSGKTLKIYQDHTSYVNTAIYSGDGNKIISGSSDGKIKIWDAKTTECLHTLTPPSPPHLNTQIAISINNIFYASNTNEQYYVCTKCSIIYLMNLNGQIIKTYSSGKRSGGDFLSACASPRGEWIYCIGEDCMLYCFSTISGKLENVIKIHENEAIGGYHHPQQNVLATWGFDGALNIIRP